MGVPSQPLPTIGQPNSTEDAKVRSALSEVQTILSGNVDAANLATKAVTSPKLAPDITTVTSATTMLILPGGVWRDVPGATMTFTTTVDTTEIIFVQVSTTLQSGNGHLGPSCNVQLNVDGTRDTNGGCVASTLGTADASVTASNFAILPLALTTGTHTLKLQAFFADDTNAQGSLDYSRMVRMSVAR